ncbi:hypothetical protein HBB16_21550 [Pseudonocardia sp. MCCB 268]|nr:hypothetical protein [Pseudonocardia cytotoxica]
MNQTTWRPRRRRPAGQRPDRSRSGTSRLVSSISTTDDVSACSRRR